MIKSKKKNSIKPKIREIANELDAEFKKHVNLVVLKDGSVVYKDYLIKENKHKNWCIYRIGGFKDLIGEFKLKTCALLAAKAYGSSNLVRYTEVKDLDTQYWSNHCDHINYKRIIKLSLDFDRYIIILNKLEDSEFKEMHFKDKITAMFRSSFA